MKLILNSLFKKYWLAICVIFILSISINSANACSEIAIPYNNQFVIGHNVDWSNKYAYLVINPAGIKRQSVGLANNFKPLQWVSKYGSATMNLTGKTQQDIGPAVPGGINQFGLTAAILWLDDTVYPPNPTHPVLASAQWVQYLLDNAKTVPDAIKLMQNIDIEPTILNGEKIPVHLVMHDALGNAAVMEYLNGKLITYQGENMPTSVLTNNIYGACVASLKQYKNFGGTLPLPSGYFSEARFVLGANFLKTMPQITSQNQSIATAFDALGYLIELPGTESPTVWSAVYDIANKTLYYRDIDNPQIRFINLNHFNLHPGQPTRALLINNNLSGNVENDLHAVP